MALHGIGAGGVPCRQDWGEHLRQSVGVDKVQERAEDRPPDVLDGDHALHAFAHLAVQQRMEHWRARHQDYAMRRQLLVIHLPRTKSPR